MIMKSDINQIGDHKINELILFTDSHHSQYCLFIFKANALLTLLNMASVNNLSDTADPKHQGLTFKSFETLMHELNQMSQELRSMEKENNNKHITDNVENMRKPVKSFENIKM